MPRYNHSRFEPDYDDWEPPDELSDLLSQKQLYQRDRVELVIAFYAAEHGGNTPTYEKIADIMHIPRSNAYKFAMQLCSPWEKRAVKKNGKFWLIDSEYSHPVIKSKFKEVLHSS